MKLQVWQAKERESIFSRKVPILPIKTIPVMYIEFDGTGTPVIPEELKGRKGKQPDGSAKTREVKIGCVFTQTTKDEKGAPIRDPDSTSYVAKIETAEEFGKRIEAEAIRRGIWNARTVVVIGDGAKWIRNLVDEHFYGAIHIVDFYHAKEHLYKLLQFLYPAQEKMKEQLPIWLKWFEAGKIETIVATARQASLTLAEKAFDEAKKEIGYFEDNASRMRYAKYKSLGLFIGSGVIEAACKNVIGKRLKQSGMRWSVKGADDIIALRCSIQSDRFDEYWESRCAI